jgi:hypothetical protein
MSHEANELGRATVNSEIRDRVALVAAVAAASAEIIRRRLLKSRNVYRALQRCFRGQE